MLLCTFKSLISILTFEQNSVAIAIGTRCAQVSAWGRPALDRSVNSVEVAQTPPAACNFGCCICTCVCIVNSEPFWAAVTCGGTPIASPSINCESSNEAQVSSNECNILIQNIIRPTLTHCQWKSLRTIDQNCQLYSSARQLNMAFELIDLWMELQEIRWLTASTLRLRCSTPGRADVSVVCDDIGIEEIDVSVVYVVSVALVVCCDGNRPECENRNSSCSRLSSNINCCSAWLQMPSKQTLITNRASSFDSLTSSSSVPSSDNSTTVKLSCCWRNGDWTVADARASCNVRRY